MTAPEPSVEPGLEYARRLHASVLDWYRSAESKAQVLLSLDGIFASFVVSSMLMRETEAREVFGSFGWETWALFGAMLAALAASIVSCLLCVVSRTLPAAELTRRYGASLEPSSAAAYPPEVLWFFQTVARLDERRYGDQTPAVSKDVEARALANQNVLLSRRVVRKHEWVNRGFLCTAATLLLFLAAGVSYVARVAP